MRNFILLVALAILSSSCISQKSLERKSDFKANLFQKESFEGLYENAVPEEEGNYSLWQDLYKNMSFKDQAFNADFTQVELELVSDKLLKANLYRRGRLEDSIELKGKIRSGYFVVDRKLTLIPLPIFYYQKELKTILGNDNEGNLVLVQGKMTEYVYFLSLFGGDRDTVTARYAKLD